MARVRKTAEYSALTLLWFYTGGIAIIMTFGFQMPLFERAHFAVTWPYWAVRLHLGI